MPRYDYECAKCGVMEIEQSIKDDKLTKCPKCESKKFERLISATGFRLKGIGWAADGYSNKGLK